MPDQFDQASDIEYAQREEAVRQSLHVDRPQYHIRFDGENCVDCSLPIPEARLLMRRVRCVACQELIDKWARR